MPRMQTQQAADRRVPMWCYVYCAPNGGCLRHGASWCELYSERGALHALIVQTHQAQGWLIFSTESALVQETWWLVLVMYVCMHCLLLRCVSVVLLDLIHRLYTPRAMAWRPLSIKLKMLIQATFLMHVITFQSSISHHLFIYQESDRFVKEYGHKKRRVSLV